MTHLPETEFAQEMALLAPRGHPHRLGLPRAPGTLGVGGGGADSSEESCQAHKEVCLKIDCSDVQLARAFPRAINGCLITKQVEKLQNKGSGIPLFVELLYMRTMRLHLRLAARRAIYISSARVQLPQG